MSLSSLRAELESSGEKLDKYALGPQNLNNTTMNSSNQTNQNTQLYGTPNPGQGQYGQSNFGATSYGYPQQAQQQFSNNNQQYQAQPANNIFGNSSSKVMPQQSKTSQASNANFDFGISTFLYFIQRYL